MPFFSDLAQLMADGKNVTLRLHKKGKQLVVMAIFDTDDGKMPPVHMEGSPKEIEAHLIPHLRKANKEITGFRADLRSFREGLQKKQTRAREKAKADAGRVSLKATTATNKKSGASGAQMSIA